MGRFYTDPSGHIFNLRDIFSNYGDLVADLSKGWNSSIAIGEYILISYGDRNKKCYSINPNTRYYTDSTCTSAAGRATVCIDVNWNGDTETPATISINSQTYFVKQEDIDEQSVYDRNAAKDLNNIQGYERKSYNGILFQKYYNADKEELAYEELVNYTGFTPQISLTGFKELLPGSSPVFEMITDGLYSYEQPGLRVELPATQEIIVGNVEKKSYTTPPAITPNKIYFVSAGTDYFSDTACTQKIGTTPQELNVTYSPPNNYGIITVYTYECCVKQEDIKSHQIQFDFSLPGPQEIVVDTDISRPGAGSNPGVIDSNNGEGDKVNLKFTLPKAQKVVLGSVTKGLPSSDPGITSLEIPEYAVDTGVLYYQDKALTQSAGSTTEETIAQWDGVSDYGTIVITNNTYYVNSESIRAATGGKTGDKLRLDFSIPGAKPIGLANPPKVDIDANLPPSVTDISEHPNDESKLQFSLPVPVRFRNLGIAYDLDQEHATAYITGANNLKRDDENNENSLKRNLDLQFHLPKNTKFADFDESTSGKDLTYASVDTNEDPNFYIDLAPNEEQDDGQYNTYKFHVKLPKAIDNDVALNPVASDSADVWTAKLTNIENSNKAKLTLNLPKAIDWSASVGQVLTPQKDPVVTIKPDINDPDIKKFVFDLPSAGAFYTGNQSQLFDWNAIPDETTKTIQTTAFPASIQTIRPGDYYIQQESSQIWYAREWQNKDTKQLTFVYKGRLIYQAPILECSTTKPFQLNTSGQYTLVQPKMTQTYWDPNNTNLKGVNYIFPSPYELNAECTMVEASKGASAKVTITGESTRTLSLEIPNKNPTIISNIEMTYNDLGGGTIEQYIENYYLSQTPPKFSPSGKPQPSDGITSVLYTDENNFASSYWYYTYRLQSGGELQWGHAVLTGDVTRLAMQSSYSDGYNSDASTKQRTTYTIQAIEQMIQTTAPTEEFYKQRGVYNVNTVNALTQQATTKVISCQIPAPLSYSEENGYYYNFISSSSSLWCGADHNVPPIITPTSNQQEYNYLLSAEATPVNAQTGEPGSVLFKFSSQIQNPINVIIVDNA